MEKISSGGSIAMGYCASNHSKTKKTESCWGLEIKLIQ